MTENLNEQMHQNGQIEKQIDKQSDRLIDKQINRLGCFIQTYETEENKIDKNRFMT